MKLMTGIASLLIAASAFGQTTKPAAAPTPPVFTLAWSEYPSWSAFGAAAELGLINGEKGKLGSIEQKYGVDIELQFFDYDTCIQSYNTSKCDAVCITNIDALPLVHGRKGVIVLPTSTSYGGDALIVPSNIATVADMKGSTVHGLGKSVSQYVFTAILEANNMPINSVTFNSMDPGVVSQALQVKDKNVVNGMLWYPMVADTLDKRKDMRALETSRIVPFHVIDSVMFGADALSHEGGNNAAEAICETYYKLNEMLADKTHTDEVLIKISEKFCNVGLASMRNIVQQVRFFGTVEQGVSVISGEPLFAEGNTLTIGKQQNKDGVVLASHRGSSIQNIMNEVVARCNRIGILEGNVTIGYGSTSEARANELCFDPQYMIATVPETPRMHFHPSPGNSPPLRKQPAK